MTYRKYTKERLEEAVAASYSVAGVLRHLGLRQAGGTNSHIKKRIDSLGIDTSHFTRQGHMKGKQSNRRLSPSKILVVLPPGSHRTKSALLRRALVESNITEKCNLCGLGPIWNGKFLQLEVDHIDGNQLDNRIDNLRFICSNCHTQQSETNRSWRKMKG